MKRKSGTGNLEHGGRRTAELGTWNTGEEEQRNWEPGTRGKKNSGTWNTEHGRSCPAPRRPVRFSEQGISPEWGVGAFGPRNDAAVYQGAYWTRRQKTLNSSQHCFSEGGGTGSNFSSEKSEKGSGTFSGRCWTISALVSPCFLTCLPCGIERKRFLTPPPL